MKVFNLFPIDGGGLGITVEPGAVENVAPEGQPQALAPIKRQVELVVREDGAIGISDEDRDALHALRAEHRSGEAASPAAKVGRLDAAAVMDEANARGLGMAFIACTDYDQVVVAYEDAATLEATEVLVKREDR